MNNFQIFILKCLRHSYLKIFPKPVVNQFQSMGSEEGNDLICYLLSREEPCMIARYGATELICIQNYLAIQKQNKNLWRYINGDINDWWWNPKIMAQMERWSGFFPPTEVNLSRFCELMLEDSKLMDVLAIFSNTGEGSACLKSYLKEDMKCFPLVSFDSFLFKSPWTECLENKKVVVIHPFAELIERQYQRREILFDTPNVLPNFNLRTVKAVQSLGGVNHGFKTWFDALDWMKGELDKSDYDIVLIGCGAYGFPLAAHAKRTGHKAVHIGGSLQLLFGIKGRRWEKELYAEAFNLPSDTYIRIMDNPAWVRPDEYRTKEADSVEGACYW